MTGRSGEENQDRDEARVRKRGVVGLVGMVVVKKGNRVTSSPSLR